MNTLFDTPTRRFLKLARARHAKWFWNEADHPRDGDGRFSSGGGGGRLTDRLRARVRTREQIAADEAARAKAVRDDMNSAVFGGPTVMERILGPAGPHRTIINSGARGSIPIGGRSAGGHDPALVTRSMRGWLGDDIEWRNDPSNTIGTWGPDGIHWPSSP